MDFPTKVSIILFYDDKNILLQKRARVASDGGIFGCFGGKANKNETPEQTLLREIKEELNFDLKEFTFFKKYDLQNPVTKHKVERNFYLAPMPDFAK